MGLVEHLRQNAEKLGDKAKEGLQAAQDRAQDFAADIQDRMDGDDSGPVSADPASTVSDAAGHASDSMGDATTAAASTVNAAVDHSTDSLGPAADTASERVSDSIDSAEDRTDLTPSAASDMLGSDAYSARDISEDAIDAVQQRADDLGSGSARA